MVPSRRYCTRCGAAHRDQDAFCSVCGQPLQVTLPSPQYPVAGPAISTSTGLLLSNLILKQRYRIIQLLGQGGFGAVYKAEDMQLGNRLLAVKEMSQSGLSQQERGEASENFKREAHLLAGLMQPNLPSIYDHFSEAGRWYLVMDYIEGQTLEEYVKTQGGKLPAKEVLDIGIQICTVLEYLHTRQPLIIFRDLKPANIMLTPQGHLYLIDFGIARHFKPGQTKDTVAFGSPGYAAPEQYGKTQSTSRADMYSLGATLHQLLTGIDPSQTPFQFASLQLQDQPIPSGLEQLIMQMLEMNKDKRPESMLAVKQELQRIALQHVAGQMISPHPGNSMHSASLPSSSLLPAQTRHSQASQTPEGQWLDKGNELYQAKHFEEALAAYDQAIQLDPKYASAHSNKSLTLLYLKRYEEALDACEQAIRFGLRDAHASNLMGDLLGELKRYEEALVVYERAIQRDPNNVTAYNFRETTLDACKRLGEALATTQRNYRLATAYCAKGRQLYKLKRYQEALTISEQAIRLNPCDASLYNLKGDVLNSLKRYQQALAAYDQAIQLDPNLAIAYHNKSLALQGLGRLKEAQQAYDRARQLGYSG